MEPDPEWSHTDSAGHTHRHTPGRFTPDTLVRVGMWVEVDGEPGEFEWIPGGTACAQCGEPVQTGWREVAL